MSFLGRFCQSCSNPAGDSQCKSHPSPFEVSPWKIFVWTLHCVPLSQQESGQESPPHTLLNVNAQNGGVRLSGRGNGWNGTRPPITPHSNVKLFLRWPRSWVTLKAVSVPVDFVSNILIFAFSCLPGTGCYSASDEQGECQGAGSLPCQIQLHYGHWHLERHELPWWAQPQRSPVSGRTSGTGPAHRLCLHSVQYSLEPLAGSAKRSPFVLYIPKLSAWTTKEIKCLVFNHNK